MLRHLKLKKEVKTKTINQSLFYQDDEKILEKYKAICTKIQDLENVELNASPVYDDRYIKSKIRTYGDKVYINFRGLNLLDEYIECKSFTVTSIDSLHLHESEYYLQVDLDNCSYKIVKKDKIK